ncbi:MAG: hypothetical protein GKC53_01430 [Neisseriaceae bacterium]|nr:MAG: hypothetical protein GKC53_01430 [Neisseriaceae bacterium]
MDYPIFSMQLNKQNTTYKFKNSQGIEITVSGNPIYGRATIQDADILLIFFRKHDVSNIQI